jgi:hypothetical protein
VSSIFIQPTTSTVTVTPNTSTITVAPVVPVVTVTPVTPLVVVAPVVNTLVVTSPGPQGIPGPLANPFFTYTQNTPLATWTIVHNLNGYPTAEVIDSGGTNVIGDFSWPNVNTLVINFAVAFSGIAYVI